MRTMLLALGLATALAACGDSKEDKEQDGHRMPAQGIDPAFGPQGTNAAAAFTPVAAGKQRIEFQGSRGDRVPALLYHPGGNVPLPTVMVQYGITGSKESGTVEEVATILNAQGYIVMVIDVPGRGERTDATGEIDPVETVLNQDLFRWYVDDYTAAANYLASRHDVDSNRLAYMGASWGAITGIPFAARDKRIKAVVSVVGGGGFFGVIPSDLDPAATVAQIAPRPLMLINATNDQVILKPFWQALHDAAPQGAQKVLLNTDHTLSGVDLPQLISQVVTFLNSALKRVQPSAFTVQQSLR